MEEKLICPICGEKTRVFMGNARKDKLCGKHADELKVGIIKQNSEGFFIETKTNQILNKGVADEEFDWLNIVNKSKNNDEEFDWLHSFAQDTVIEHKCLTCNEDSGNYLFCKKCYIKYKNKSIILKITNCSDIEILKADYESTRSCEDGHIVKSKSEVIIDNYLFHKGIAHAYEKNFPIDDNPEHDLHPDFYLPEKDIYIEHWGNEKNEIYQKAKQYKIEQYKKARVTVISTNEIDMDNASAALDRKLKFYKQGEYNE